MSLTIENLEFCFLEAEALACNYVAIVVKMDGFPSNEIIINKCENFESKLDYYKCAYNKDLTHKFSKGISIVGFTFGDTFEEIESDLFGV